MYEYLSSRYSISSEEPRIIPKEILSMGLVIRI